MARPRKDADAPDARTRIIEAFWELIENNSIFELSVGEVTRAAQCNRGTFYYYFHDFDELVAIAIAQLLQDNELITDALWHFSSEGDLSAFDRRDVRCLLQRIVITMRAGAAEQVVQGIHTIIIDRVREIVHPDGEELKADSSFAVGFLVSGIMGFVMAVGFAREGGEEIDLEQPGGQRVRVPEGGRHADGGNGRASRGRRYIRAARTRLQGGRCLSRIACDESRRGERRLGFLLRGACRASRGESRDAVITCIHVSRVYRYSSSC